MLRLGCCSIIKYFQQRILIHPVKQFARDKNSSLSPDNVQKYHRWTLWTLWTGVIPATMTEWNGGVVEAMCNILGAALLRTDQRSFKSHVVCLGYFYIYSDVSCSISTFDFQWAPILNVDSAKKCWAFADEATPPLDQSFVSCLQVPKYNNGSDINFNSQFYSVLGRHCPVKVQQQ